MRNVSICAPLGGMILATATAAIADKPKVPMDVPKIPVPSKCISICTAQPNETRCQGLDYCNWDGASCHFNYCCSLCSGQENCTAPATCMDAEVKPSTVIR